MIAEPERNPHQDDYESDKRARRHQQEALDEALKDIPTSDPVSMEQPAPPAADRDSARPEARRQSAVVVRDNCHVQAFQEKMVSRSLRGGS